VVQPSIYLETTILSYLTAWPSADLIMAANQHATSLWWRERRHLYDLYVSELVMIECAGGDPDAARRRLELAAPFPLLAATEETRIVARALVLGRAVPEAAAADAAHIAVAAVHAMEYLLTWNLRHMANATMREVISNVCRDEGYRSPIICTPAELMGE
jgi:hypothetical protein